MLGKQVASEKTLIVWLACTIAASASLMGVAAPIVYVVYGCWPFATTQTTGGCLAHIEPEFIRFLPSLLGVVAGTAWTHRIVSGRREVPGNTPARSRQRP